MSSQTVVIFRFALKACIATGLLTNMAPPVFSRPNETENISEQLTLNTDADSSKDPDNDDGHGQSEAVRLGEIQESLEQDQKQLANLEQELENPSGEYALAEKDYRSLKDELDLSNEKLEAARKSNDAKKIKQLQQEISSLQRQHKLAEDRFDLAIEDRRSQREQKTTLRRKIENDKAALAAITGDGQQERSEDTNQTNKATNSRESHANVDHRNHSNDHDIRDDERSLFNRKQQETSDSLEKSRESEVSDEQDTELSKAVDEAEEKERMADEAQEETKSIAARLADIQKLVVQEQKELNLARKKVDLASAAQLTLSQELARRAAEQAEESELSEFRASIGNASNRLILARSEVAEISERLNDHRADQSSLQSEHIVALHEAEKKRQEAKDAENRIDEIRNPFTMRNILHWVIEHGPRILAIVTGMFILNWLSSFFAARSVRLVTTSSGRGSKLEKENRAKTLVGVFQNASTVGIFIAGVMMVLDEIGANITVLMGGVAVIGLAVAFGAQNLIKDYFYGFVMLLENQYMLNDSVRVGGVSGQVERITLRMTVLRDSNGVVHFIPNGTINSVSNETHGWSRAVCEIAVGHHEGLDRICEILNAISLELKADPVFGSLLLETPTSPAIESLGESAVYLKMSAKTLPNKQGAIKQEWLKRIKNRFGELGIQHPFPQRTVHVQSGPVQSGHVQSEDSVSEQNGRVLTRQASYRQAS